MCGRINVAGMNPAELKAYFDLGKVPMRLLARYNVPPTTPVPIVREQAGELVMEMARWGLIPTFQRGWLRDWKATSFNARTETVATAPTFRGAYKYGRCLQVAAGYYEWMTGNGQKTPVYIHPAGNAPAFAMAALYTDVELADYHGLTVATVTEPARGGMARVHDRMPVILGPEGMKLWLAGAPIEDIPRIDPSRIDWHEVSRDVGNVRNDGPELIEPVWTQGEMDLG